MKIPFLIALIMIGEFIIVIEMSVLEFSVLEAVLKIKDLHLFIQVMAFYQFRMMVLREQFVMMDLQIMMLE